MFTKRTLFVLLIFVLLPALVSLPAAWAQGSGTSPTYTAQGPYPVGVMEFEAETPYHSTTMILWYPAVYPLGRTVRPGLPLKDAAPDPSGGPYPLSVFVPGWMADRHGGTSLGDHLASYGFVMMAIDPIDVAGGGHEDWDDLLLRRPQEVTWQIDYAASLTAAGGGLEGMIDLDHIAVVGHSLGGHTALMAGGARLNWSFLPVWCGEHYESEYAPNTDVNFCDNWVADQQSPLAPLAGLDPSQPGLWPSWGDARVDAVVSLSPYFWVILGPEGMGSVTLPLLLIGGAKDKNVPLDWNLFYENAGSTEKALVILENSDHMVLASDQRACAHFITAFLLATLKGDTDAAAALAPDTVAFPGVTYEAQGF